MERYSATDGLTYGILFLVICIGNGAEELLDQPGMSPAPPRDSQIELLAPLRLVRSVLQRDGAHYCGQGSGVVTGRKGIIGREQTLFPFNLGANEAHPRTHVCIAAHSR